MELFRISKNRGRLTFSEANVVMVCVKKRNGTRVNIHIAGERMEDAGLRCGDRAFVMVSRDLSVMEIVRTTSKNGYTISSPGRGADGNMRSNGCIAIQDVAGTPLEALKLGDRVEYPHTGFSGGKVMARQASPVQSIKRNAKG